MGKPSQRHTARPVLRLAVTRILLRPQGIGTPGIDLAHRSRERFRFRPRAEIADQSCVVVGTCGVDLETHRTAGNNHVCHPTTMRGVASRCTSRYRAPLRCAVLFFCSARGTLLPKPFRPSANLATDPRSIPRHREADYANGGRVARRSGVLTRFRREGDLSC